MDVEEEKFVPTYEGTLRSHMVLVPKSIDRKSTRLNSSH